MGARSVPGPIRTFLLVPMPLVWPGIISGALFAFILSLDELNTALFLRGPGITTLPIEIFSYLQFQGGQLVIAAASAMQVRIILVLVVAVERLIGLRRIVRGRSARLTYGLSGPEGRRPATATRLIGEAGK